MALLIRHHSRIHDAINVVFWTIVFSVDAFVLLLLFGPPCVLKWFINAIYGGL